MNAPGEPRDGRFPMPGIFFLKIVCGYYGGYSWIFLIFFLITEAIFSTTDTLGGHALHTHFRNVYRASVQNRNGV